MKLDVKACALACGLIWGVGLFVLTWWVIAFDGSTGEATFIGRVYRGYSITPIGSMVGMVWGGGRWLDRRRGVRVAVQPIGDGAITIAIAPVIRFAVAIKGCSAEIKYKSGVQ